MTRASLWHRSIILLPLLAFFVSWQYNGSQIPLLLSSILLILLWGSILLWQRIHSGLALPVGKLPLFMLGWLLWYACTLLWTTIPYVSWFYFWGLASLPLAYLFWLLQDDVELAWRICWPLLVLGALILAGWGLYQCVQHLGRPKGPLADVNSYAAFINLLFFPILTRFILHTGKPDHKTDWGNICYLGVLALLLLAFFATVSRGASLVWLLVLPLALWNLRQQPYFKSKTIAVLLLAGSAFATRSSSAENFFTSSLSSGITAARLPPAESPATATRFASI